MLNAQFRRCHPEDTLMSHVDEMVKREMFVNDNSGDCEVLATYITDHYINQTCLTRFK